MKAKIGTERNRISPGVSGVHGEAQLDVYLRDQVVRLRPTRRKNALSEEKKIDLHGCGCPYRLSAILLNHRTLALVVEVMMMRTEQGWSGKGNNPDNLPNCEGSSYMNTASFLKV